MTFPFFHGFPIVFTGNPQKPDPEAGDAEAPGHEHHVRQETLEAMAKLPWEQGGFIWPWVKTYGTI